MVAESSEGSSARLLPQGVGIVADVAAVSALVIAGGSPLVVAAGALAVFTGVYVVWKRWAKPVDRTLAVAVAVAALGAGVIGFSLKSAAVMPPPAGANATGSTTTGHSTTTTTSSRTSTATTTAAPVSATSPPTTSTTTVPTNRKLYNSSSEREIDSVDLDDDSTAGKDLTIGPMSLDSENGAQFALLQPGAPDPTYDVCATRPDGDWRTSIPLAEFRDVVRIFCVRTDDHRLGFVEVSAVRMDTAESIDSVYLRSTIWE